MDREGWQATVQEVAKSQSRLSTHMQTLLQAWGFGTRHREHPFMDEMHV